MTEDETMGHASEKIVQSVLLTAWSRLSMALALPLIAALIWFGKAYIDDKFADAGRDIAAAATVATEAQTKAINLDRRVLTVENNQLRDNKSSEKFQQEMMEQMRIVQDSLSKLSNAVSGLTSTVQMVVEDRRNQKHQ